MTKYYIFNRHGNPPEEITEAEYKAITGEYPVSSYASKVYRMEITMEDVPEEHREATQAVVDAKIARMGVYEIPDAQALNIITGGNAE